MRVTITVTLTQGDRIRLAREQAGLKQTELAMRLRVGRSTVANWENGVNAPHVRNQSLTSCRTYASLSDMPDSDILPDPEEWISPGRAALILGCNPKTIARYADDGALRVERRDSGHRRVLLADVNRLRDQRAAAITEAIGASS